MFKLRLLTAAGAAVLLASTASAQTTQPSPSQAQDQTSAQAKAAKDQAMKNVPADSSTQSTMPRATTDQSAQAAQPAATTQEASAQQATSKEGMSDRTTRAWVEMDAEEITVGGSRLFTLTVTDEATGQSMEVITNGPVPDNAANRAEWPPLSAAGRRTRPLGN